MAVTPPIDAMHEVAPPPGAVSRWRLLEGRPLPRLVLVRSALGLLTLLAVSVLVFVATQVLPGNAATAALGHSATPDAIRALEDRLHVHDSIPAQYWAWLSHVVRGQFGTSLVNGRSVTHLIGPRLANSAVLVALAAVLSTLLGMLAGAYAALRRDRASDHALSLTAVIAGALPEFVVGIFVVLLFSVNVFHWFPAVSVLPPGEYIWQHPDELVLPLLTMLIVVTPYTYRMMRGATIEALASDYVELAELKGMSPRQILLRHAMPNALAPTIQVIGLNILYLAGGIVLVENVFNFAGVGQALVAAVSDRNIPVVQFITLVLAVVYVVVNILTDVLVLLLTPRRRIPR